MWRAYPFFSQNGSISEKEKKEGEAAFLPCNHTEHRWPPRPIRVVRKKRRKEHDNIKKKKGEKTTTTGGLNSKDILMGPMSGVVKKGGKNTRNASCGPPMLKGGGGINASVHGPQPETAGQGNGGGGGGGGETSCVCPHHDSAPPEKKEKGGKRRTAAGLVAEVSTLSEKEGGGGGNPHVRSGRGE